MSRAVLSRARAQRMHLDAYPCGVDEGGRSGTPPRNRVCRVRTYSISAAGPKGASRARPKCTYDGGTHGERASGTPSLIGIRIARHLARRRADSRRRYCMHRHRAHSVSHTPSPCCSTRTPCNTLTLTHLLRIQTKAWLSLFPFFDPTPAPLPATRTLLLFSALFARGTTRKESCPAVQERPSFERPPQSQHNSHSGVST